MFPRIPLLGLVLALAFPAAASAQDRWSERVQAFAAENRGLDPERENVVLFGSSSMEGWEQSRRIERFLPTVGARTLNRGISGDGIGFTVGPGKKGLRNRLDASVFDTYPSHVFILNGRNSIGSGVEKTANAYRALVKTIRQRLPKVVVSIVTCAPVNHRYAHLASKVLQLNARLRTIAKEEGCWLIDLFPHLVGPDGLMRPSLTRDGLHFKDAGYEVLGRGIERVVAQSNAKKEEAEREAAESETDGSEARGGGRAQPRCRTSGGAVQRIGG